MCLYSCLRYRSIHGQISHIQIQYGGLNIADHSLKNSDKLGANMCNRVFAVSDEEYVVGLPKYKMADPLWYANIRKISLILGKLVYGWNMYYILYIKIQKLQNSFLAQLELFCKYPYAVLDSSPSISIKKKTTDSHSETRKNLVREFTPKIRTVFKMRS